MLTSGQIRYNDLDNFMSQSEAIWKNATARARLHLGMLLFDLQNVIAIVSSKLFFSYPRTETKTFKMFKL